ncbi:asparagine synthetase A [Desulfurococcus amylolyticus]|uniref:asparagine synthetase A n=1 Tax=Desulfurococcus amylolyticus TaxID=94694 RepID=UPI0005B231DB|nr:asparagine synthetase A [Desulfurococcus amylolyticus]
MHKLFLDEEIAIYARIKPLDSSRILVRDATGEKEVRILGEKARDITSLPCESTVLITGVLTEQGLKVKDFKVLHKPLEPAKICVDNVPLDPAEYVRNYPIYIRRPEILRVVKTYSIVLRTMRRILDKHGFTELSAPIIGYVSDPGLRGAEKAIVKIYGETYEVQSSVIMYKQLYASLLGKIYYVARNLRIEPPENMYTGRHLVEFTQVDVEASITTASDMMRLAEETLYKTVRYMLNHYSELLTYDQVDFLEKTITKPPYPRIDYDSALGLLERKGYRLEHGKEISFEAEAVLGDMYGTPVWLHGFPTVSRGFYYMPDPEKPGYNIDYNLILPGHAGEVLDGGCREYRYEKLVERIKYHGEPLEKYRWFLELAKAGAIQPSCGWGMGVERLVKYIHRLRHVAYASPHPRIPGIIGP